MWETHAPQYIYNAFNAHIGTLPLQIGVEVSIAVSSTFSQSFYFYFFFNFFLFFTFAILPLLCFYKLYFQRSHRRLLTLRRLLVFR